MNRPVLEIADLVRAAGDGFVECSRQWIRWKHVKVLLAIARCRTAAFGGHFDKCTDCGHRIAISYNSCSDRDLPKVSDRCPRPLDRRTPQGTAPDSLGPCGLHASPLSGPAGVADKKVIYHLLFRSSAETLWKSLVIPNVSAPKLAFSACCIVGVKNWKLTRAWRAESKVRFPQR